MAVSSVSTSFHPMRHPPFRVCGRGNQKQQAFYVPRRLPEEARPPALADSTLTPPKRQDQYNICLLYTSDAADEEDSADLDCHRIIKKNTKKTEKTEKKKQKNLRSKYEDEHSR